MQQRHDVALYDFRHDHHRCRGRVSALPTYPTRRNCWIGAVVVGACLVDGWRKNVGYSAEV